VYRRNHSCLYSSSSFSIAFPLFFLKDYHCDVWASCVNLQQLFL